MLRQHPGRDDFVRVRAQPFLAFAGVMVATTVFQHTGGMGLLAWRSAAATLSGRVHVKDILAQGYSIGVQSVPLVLVTAALSGIVTSQQGGYQFTSSIPLYVLGSVVTSGVSAAASRCRPLNQRARSVSSRSP